jgi:hypothetical protein
MRKAVVACVLLGSIIAVTAGSTAAAPAGRTAAVIETVVRGSTQGTSHKGTFKIITDGLERGAVSTTVHGFTSGKRNGQSYEVIRATDTLKGKGWTLLLTTRDSVGVSAGAGYGVITGSWTVTRGTGKYAGARGGGHAATVVLPADGSTLTSHSRYQGFITTP